MLPPHIMTSEPGSFAEHTIVRRKPQIIADVIAHNDYPAEIVAALKAFAREIAGGTVKPLQHNTPDAIFWRKAWQPWGDKTWRQLPWFFAEAYFYRRLLEHGIVDLAVNQARSALLTADRPDAAGNSGWRPSSNLSLSQSIQYAQSIRQAVEAAVADPADGTVPRPLRAARAGTDHHPAGDLLP